MNKRQLTLFLGLALVIAVVAAAAILNLEKNEYALAKQSGTEVAITELEAGDFQIVDIADQEVWVYRRTQKEIEEINRLAPFLVDPQSIESQQPDIARNRFRSPKAEYFVFYPQTSKVKCLVKFNSASEFEYDELYTAAPIHEYTHFREACEGHLFDTAGRVLKTGDYNGELNLQVPDLVWVDDHKFILLGQK